MQSVLKLISVALFLLSSFVLFAGEGDTLTGKGRKVYIEPVFDAEANAKADKELRDWAYWQVVNNKSDADFVLRIKIEKKRGIRVSRDDRTANIEYIEPHNNEVFKRSKKVNTLFMYVPGRYENHRYHVFDEMALNTAIHKLIKKRLRNVYPTTA